MLLHSNYMKKHRHIPLLRLKVHFVSTGRGRLRGKTCVNEEDLKKDI